MFLHKTLFIEDSINGAIIHCIVQAWQSPLSESSWMFPLTLISHRVLPVLLPGCFLAHVSSPAFPLSLPSSVLGHLSPRPLLLKIRATYWSIILTWEFVRNSEFTDSTPRRNQNVHFNMSPRWSVFTLNLRITEIDSYGLPPSILPLSISSLSTPSIHLSLQYIDVIMSHSAWNVPYLSTSYRIPSCSRDDISVYDIR